ncbi:hypothetical protein GH714_022578 [Hevea brasiliensis]|uniref:Cadmium-induced protein AS8 n=1 Tax=Hevea brasiliensis TaxID=3981 RepID=A0A6A6M8P5_HEVBR|nr:hypothetical protein GH714_022578 [Hevea brasiliensis]
MIIKGLFRRYQRWNPVHPTFGTFWGMGLGIGCGVGWGPGFGPEVIGYVGAGCGVGFSVGITLAGFGIGLPANYVFEVPYNAIVATSRCALMFARSSGLLSGKDVAGQLAKLQFRTGFWLNLRARNVGIYVATRVGEVRWLGITNKQENSLLIVN